MRGLKLSLAVLLLAGCVTANERGPAPDDPPADTLRDPPMETSAAEVEAPTHPVGRAWTYEGVQQYNPESRMTVVVARADASGYLFAGDTEADLVYEALWANQLYGERDRDMNRVEWKRTTLDFPLTDGKTWSYRKDLTVTARAADVRTPSGTDAGFLIEGENDRVRLTYEYSPALGQIVSFRAERPDGHTYDDLRLTKVEEARGWMWYELGELTVVPSPAAPSVFEVADGFDAIIASAGGLHGSRAHVQGPGGESWSAEFAQEETWQHGVLPATPGRWSGAIVGRADAPVEQPVGWAYMHVAPVRWLTSD